MGLTPEQRSARARIAAHAMHAKNDSKEVTEKWRAKSPGRLAYWESKVDPDGTLPDGERVRRAEHERKAYMTRLALKSSQSRRRKH